MKKITLSLISLIFTLSLSAQEGFNIEFGQFFEQGYGGALNEEGIDLGPFNSDKLMVGWQDVSENESTSKDAVIWHLTDRGEEQYSKIIGTTDWDEVATGVVQVAPETYAVCVHQSSKWKHMNLSAGDQTWVYLIQSGGTVLWSYNYQGGEEGGVAPSDIMYDRSGNIVVLVNKILGNGQIVNEVLNINTIGQLNWVSPAFIQSHLGGWAFELLESSSGYMSIVNDKSFNYPIAWEFSNAGGSISLIEHYTSNEGDRLFGLDYDSISQTIVTAGYTVTENDTDAIVLNLQPTLQKIGQWNYGVLGSEKLIDIVATGDGYVAGGVRGNKGEGKYDCYILHLTGTFNTYAEETFGGQTSERLNNLNLMLGGTDVWFAGYNREWEIAESGNAYLGGTTLGWSLTGATCEIPRVMWVDGLLKPDATSTYVSGYSIGDPASNIATLNDLNRLNVNTLVLFDIDKMLVALDNSSLDQSDQVVIEVQDFISKATASPYNFTVGIVMGPGLNKLNLTNDWMSAMSGVSYWNYTKSSKLNFMVLEHEFWNLSQESSFRLLDQSAWVNKNLISSLNPSLPTNVNIATSTNPSFSTTIRDLYFQQSVADHHFLLDELSAEAMSSANNWKILDYIRSFKNDASASAWGGALPTYYGNIDLNNASTNLVSAEITVGSHRAFLAEYSKVKSDAIFLVYNREPQWVNDYDLGSLTGVWVLRLLALMERQPLMQANIIPLLYSEAVGCQIGYDEYGNPKSSSLVALGGWLGANNGNNTLKQAESYYISHHTNQFYSTVGLSCSTCISDIKITGFGWYTYNCLLEAESNNGMQNASLNGRVSCGSVGGFISQNEEPLMATLKVFPNPASDLVTIIGIESGMTLEVYNQLGQLVKKTICQDDPKFEISKLPPGFYTFYVPELKKGSKIIIRK